MKGEEINSLSFTDFYLHTRENPSLSCRVVYTMWRIDLTGRKTAAGQPKPHPQIPSLQRVSFLGSSSTASRPLPTELSHHKTNQNATQPNDLLNLTLLS